MRNADEKWEQCLNMLTFNKSGKGIRNNKKMMRRGSYRTWIEITTLQDRRGRLGKYEEDKKRRRKWMRRRRLQKIRRRR